MVESGFGISSKSGTEQTVSSKNELKFIHICGSVCSVSISVSGGKQSKYSGLRVFLWEYRFQANDTVKRQFFQIELETLHINPSYQSSWETLFLVRNHYFRWRFWIMIKSYKRPRYRKFHRDIELIYETNRWIVRDHKLGNTVLVSFTDAFCPEHIVNTDWIYKDFENNLYKNDQE